MARKKRDPEAERSTQAHETTLDLSAFAEFTTREQRVDAIAELMRTLTWETGRTGKKLAPIWDVTAATVRDYAAEASRRVRSEVTDPEGVSRDVCQALRIAMTSCLQSRDWTRMTKAAEAWAAISGAKAAEKVDMMSVVEASPEAARKLMAERFGRLTPKASPPDDSPGSQ